MGWRAGGLEDWRLEVRGLEAGDPRVRGWGFDGGE